VALISSAATIKDPDSPVLAKMTVSIVNPKDGDFENLSADVSRTPIKASISHNVLTLSGPANREAFQQVLRTVRYRNTAPSPTAGNRSVRVVVNDGIVNGKWVYAAVAVAATPTGYTVVARDPVLGQSNATSTGFTLAQAVVGATYRYTITSSGGGTPVTGSGAVTAANQSVAGIDVSTLPDGVLTFSVTLTGPGGATGPAATATATLDQTAPAGYAIEVMDAMVNLSKATSTGLALTGAEVGTVYHYTITSSGGGTPLTGSGTVTAATQSLTGINVTSLPDGALTYSVTLTDAAGNTGTAATAVATMDATAPRGYVITPNDLVINAAEAASTGFTFAGAEVGATYRFTVTSSGGGTPVTGTGTVTSATVLVTGIDVSSLPDGTLTFTVTLTDWAGNVGPEVTATATLARTVAPLPGTVTLSNNTVAAGQSGATVGTLGMSDPGTYAYMLVDGAGDNAKFTITGGDQLSTAQALAPQSSYSVTVLGFSVFLASTPVSVTGITGPYVVQMTYDPSTLPTSAYEQPMANSGYLYLAAQAIDGSWDNAVLGNAGAAGQYAQARYLGDGPDYSTGSWNNFWLSVTAAHPTATTSDVLGSWGVDTTNHVVWAVVDFSDQFAAQAVIVAQKTFTVTAV
jgi:hypothetical protein